MPAPLLLSETPRPDVRVLTLNRPERRNAMVAELCQALHDELDAVAADRACRAVVLTGAPPAFCVGLDRALEAAEQIAAWSPWGIRLTKQGMWSALEIGSERAAIEYEDRQQIMAVHGTAVGEAVGAFLEKRPAQFAD